VELVDGQLRIAQDSLVVVAQREDPQQYDVVYENNSRVTSSSYTQRTKSDRWTAEETEQFFRALSQFGTDFSVIAQLFPNRSRKQLKNKFKKEEREHPERLESALRHKMPIDEAEFDSRMRARAGSSDTAAVPAAAEEAAADAGGAQAEADEAEAETAQAPRGDP
jgi:transcription factor TFIIIB component B''